MEVTKEIIADAIEGLMIKVALSSNLNEVELMRRLMKKLRSRPLDELIDRYNVLKSEEKRIHEN